MSADGTVLAFDFGTRRIGVAVGQTVSATAAPLATIPVRDARPDWPALARLVADWEPDMLVVGEPSCPDGSPHPLSPAVQRFARQLEGRFGLPVQRVDERLSSHEAATHAASRSAGVDAVAAQLILETWMQQHRAAG